MNPSQPFILRPVATTLLMIAIMLSGMLAFKFPSGRRFARGGLSDHPGADLLSRRQSGCHDLVGHRTAGSAVRPDAEPQPDEFGEFRRRVGHHAAIRSRYLSLDIAEQEVQAAINAAGNLLPADLPAPPIYAKVNPADAPVLTLAADVEDDAADAGGGLRRHPAGAEISQFPGVGLVSISGGQRPAVRILAESASLAAYGLNIDDLRTTLRQCQCQHAQGQFRRRDARLHHQRQRPDHECGGLRER